MARFKVVTSQTVAIILGTAVAGFKMPRGQFFSVVSVGFKSLLPFWRVKGRALTSAEYDN